MRAGAAPPELTRYPVPERWSGERGRVPRILAVTLPALAADPVALFDELAAVVPGFPDQPLHRHHLMFLDLLAARAGRLRWVERSGGSSFYASRLLGAYPEAKVIYLTRDGDANARSMSRHPSFQLMDARLSLTGALGYDPYASEGPQHAALPPELERYLPDRLSARALAQRADDPGRFVMISRFLSGAAEQAIAQHEPEHLLRVRYEDLVRDPAGELARVGRFLGFADWSDWSDRCAPHVHRPSAASPGSA